MGGFEKNLPVQDVEESIETKSCDIVRGEVLNYAHLVEHHNLWNECDCLKPD